MMTAPPNWDHVGGYGPESLAGHSGSETSEAAAMRPKGKRMKSVYDHLEEIGPVGATSAEIQNYFNIGHGAASGALTRLHRAGYATRLTDQRGGQQVYVLVEFVGDREESPYRPNAAYREDRAPMPLERPEPTLESITADISEEWRSLPQPFKYTRRLPDLLAPAVLRIVRKYR